MNNISSTLVLILFLLCGCRHKDQKPLNLSHEARQEIWEADVAMSELALKEGLHRWKMEVGF